MCTNCAHSHNHEHHHDKINKTFYLTIILTIVLLAIAHLNFVALNFKIAIYFIAYILVGKDIIIEALGNIFKGHIFDENFLMTTATLCAFLIGEYPEAVMVMLLYKIGEFLQDKAVVKSKNSITKLIDLRQDSANVLIGNEIKVKNAKEVKIGDIIIVKKGEKIPLDGTIIQGSADIDTSALSGESMPKYSTIADEVLSGCVLSDGYLKIKVEREFSNSTASKILELIKKSADKKASSEKFITKFARYYTPIVVILAILLTIVPTVILGGDFNLWFKRALTFLVISCPCALVISIPLGFFAGIGKASKGGILIKGSEFIEKLTNIASFVFDKTGTLTKGNFEIGKIVSLCSLNEDEILKIVCKIESFSNHPIAKAFKNCYQNLDIGEIKEINEAAGNGISAKIGNDNYTVGRKNFLETNNINISNIDNEESKVIYLAKNKEILGYITLSDKIKNSAQEAITELKKYSENIVILSGDSEKSVEKTAQELKIKNYYSNLLPQDKLNELEKIISNKIKKKNVIYIGDGINDAPSLKLADIGIAVGTHKTDSAIEASDIVIMNDNLLKIGELIKISKKTMAVVKENIAFSIFVKVLFLTLGAFGLIGIQGAVFADVGVTLIAVLNSLRILK